MNFESNNAAQQAGAAPLRALCIARHCFLSEHLARYFREMGVVTTEAVGLESAVSAAGEASPDVVICDYDLLASIPLEKWEHDGLLSKTPVIAVSLTRHAEELHLLDVNGIAGFLYLPTLEQAPALRILRAAATRPKYTLSPSFHTAPRTVERG
jgi:DNA-binding NarL/FixJ family response regulator